MACIWLQLQHSKCMIEISLLQRWLQLQKVLLLLFAFVIHEICNSKLEFLLTEQSL